MMVLFFIAEIRYDNVKLELRVSSIEKHKEIKRAIMHVLKLFLRERLIYYHMVILH